MRVISGNVVSAALLGVVMLLSPPAAAREYMPGELQKLFDMPCVPQCTVCHETNAGGRGTAKKDFVAGWMGVGFSVNDRTAFVRNAADLKAAGIDSDGDQVSDFEELHQGLDPNVAGAASLCGPEYGCARIESRGRIDGFAGAASAAVLLIGASLLRRRRSR